LLPLTTIATIPSMKEGIRPFIAKSNEPIIAYGQELQPDQAIGILLNHEYDKGWNFFSGYPEFWVFKDKLLVPGGKALDLGIGTGRSSQFFALQGMQVTGYEIEPDPLALMRGVIDRYGISSIDLREENVREADLGQELFDTVIMAQTFVHFPSKQAAFDVLHKSISALKKGGHLWFRAAGTHDEAYEELSSYARHGSYGITQVNEDVFMAPCSCSGEMKMEPQLFLEPMEVTKVFADNNMTLVHTQLAPQEGQANIMYGEDFNRSQRPPLISGHITILARK